MAAITYANLAPQDTDSALDLKYKELLNIRASSKTVLGTNGDTTLDPDTADSWQTVQNKVQSALVELKVALGG